MEDSFGESLYVPFRAVAENLQCGGVRVRAEAERKLWARDDWREGLGLRIQVLRILGGTDRLKKESSFGERRSRFSVKHFPPEQ